MDNVVAYHLAKSVIEKYMGKYPKLTEMFDEMIMDFGGVFPDKRNGWNYFFEEKMAELGFIRIEDKQKIVDYYKSKQPSAKEMEAKE